MATGPKGGRLGELPPEDRPREKLVARGLAMLPGEPVLVAGSETTALTVLLATLEVGMSLRLNCCTWRFKSAAQLRGARARAATFLLHDGERQREDGLIEGASGLFDARVVPHLTYMAPFREVTLSTGRRIAMERRPAP